MNHGFEAVNHGFETSGTRAQAHITGGGWGGFLAITPKVAWLATKMAPLYLDGEIAILRTVSSAPTIITLTLPWMQQPMRRSPFILKLVSFLTRCFGSRHNELMILETKRLYNVCILYPVHCRPYTVHWTLFDPHVFGGKQLWCNTILNRKNPICGIGSVWPTQSLKAFNHYVEFWGFNLFSG